MVVLCAGYAEVVFVGYASHLVLLDSFHDNLAVFFPFRQSGAKPKGKKKTKSTKGRQQGEEGSADPVGWG